MTLIWSCDVWKFAVRVEAGIAAALVLVKVFVLMLKVSCVEL